MSEPMPPHTAFRSAPSAVTLHMLRSQGLIHAIEGDPQTTIRGVQHDSRKVQPGDMFVAIGGTSYEGANFVEEAIRRGAVAVLSEHRLNTTLAQAIASQPRLALGQVAAMVYGYPTHALQVTGITGTNGKTTVSYLLEAAIAAAGGVPAVMGTINQRGPDYAKASSHTTPEGDDIARFARAMVDKGATHLVMEVSSHALSLHRVDAVDFQVAAFTNLSQDHLDFHGQQEAYFEAKERLFKCLTPRASVINVDDVFGQRLLSTVQGSLVRCTLSSAMRESEFSVIDHILSLNGIEARLATPKGELLVKSSLIGLHNLQNMVVTLGCVFALGLDLSRAAQGIAGLKGVPGRLQRVSGSQGPVVFVDYAHTPAALEAALQTLSSLCTGRIIVVFGCGGDRDKDKRSHMGRVAGHRADVVILTNDNPRSESPSHILDAIEQGVRLERTDRMKAEELHGASRGYAVIEDRRQAIECAIRSAHTEDVVLVAGKGHENYQILGAQKLPFDDYKIANEALLQWGGPLW